MHPNTPKQDAHPLGKRNENLGSVVETTSDLRKRGYEVEDPQGITRETDLLKRLQLTGNAGWKQVRSEWRSETGRQARERLLEFQHGDNNARRESNTNYLV